MKLLLVGGDFNNQGGRPSSLVIKFAQALKNEGALVTLKNGGHFSEIESILNSTTEYDVVFWWAHVPNDYPKFRNVKEINPKTLLVGSKRNDDNQYSFMSLINRALEIKANLSVEFKKNENGLVSFLVFDPLGNSWYEGNIVEECSSALFSRLTYLLSVTRHKSHKDTGAPPQLPDNEPFFNYVRKSAEIFHEMIKPDKDVTRFLGNSSFRCQKGFPSFKKGNIVFVSRRNIDKRYINKDNFVATYLKNGDVYYYGENKPSVDTPIQLRLYELFPKINYMVHSHCYSVSNIFTKTPVPCGSTEEVDEIKKVVTDFSQDFYIINLIGHGFLVMSDTVEKLETVEFYSRNAPEKMY